MDDDIELSEYQKYFKKLKDLRKRWLDDDNAKILLKQEIIKGLKSSNKKIVNDTAYRNYDVFLPEELFKVIIELAKEESSSQNVPIILNIISGDFEYGFEEFKEDDQKYILERYDHFHHLGVFEFLEGEELEYFDCKVDLSTMKGLDKLKNLKRLSLDHVDVRELPEWIGNMKSLQKLEIYDNYLTNLPETIGNLTSLKKFEVSWNNLEYLPESIGNLHSLEILDLHMNKLSSLPNSIGNLQKLEKLDLSYNQLSDLPKSIGNITLLQELKLDGIGSITLPSSLENLKRLEELTLRNSKIKNPEVLNSLRHCGVKIIK